MTHALKTALLAAAMIASAAAAHAQTPRAYGRWEGVINTQLGSAPFQVDIGADATGKPIAALTIVEESIRGLPLGNVKIEGDKVGFEMPSSGEGAFLGLISADGQTFTGSVDKGLASPDFSMTRTGEAHFPAEPKNQPVDAGFVGEWTGMLGAIGRDVRISLANQGDAAIGRISVGDGGVGIPLAIVQSGEAIELTLASAGESFTGKLDATGRLVGDYHSGSGGRTPVSLQRAQP